MRQSLLVVALLAAACSRPSSTTEPTDARPPRGCRRADPAPKLEAVPEFQPTESHVTLRVSVTERRLRQEIAAELPQTLDSGQRTQSGVRVSYVVKRGDLSFDLDGDMLYLETPVTGSATACKTLGPLCPVLGSCSPKFDVRVGIPVVLTEHYTFVSSQVTTKMVRGCTIAGFNASGEIRSRAAGEAKKAQSEIDRSLPAVQPLAKAGWETLHRTIDLGNNACLRVVPKRVVQERPKQADGVLSSAAHLAGDLTLEQPCSSTEPPTPSALPPMKVEEAVADGIVLRAPLRVDWSTVAALAVESLAGKVAVQRLELHAAQVDSAPRIVMELEHGDDPCGAVWLTAKPKFDAAKNAIRFTDVAVYPKWNPKRKVGNLTKQLEQYASVPLPVPLVELGNRLNALQSELVPTVDEAQVDITLGPPTVVEIALDEKGLVPIVGLTGSATVLAD